MQPCEKCAKMTSLPEDIHKIIQEQLLCADQRTDDWIKARASLVTASDVAAVLNMNFFTPAAVVMHRKLAAITGDCGHLTPFCGNEATDWGTHHEPAALEAFCARTGHKVVTTGLLRHRHHAFLGGSPDGITWCGAILEIKCPFSGDVPVIRSVPRHYLPQVQILMEIANLERAYFIQFRPQGYGPKGVVNVSQPERFNLLEVPRDRAWAETHLPTLEKFHNDLLRMVETLETSLLEDSD